jgi:hypothetical protein
MPINAYKIPTNAYYSLSYHYAIPDANIAVVDKRKFENVVLEEAFDVSSEGNNLRPPIKHFCLTINLSCLNMKSSSWARKAIVRRRCLVRRARECETSNLTSLKMSVRFFHGFLPAASLELKCRQFPV